MRKDNPIPAMIIFACTFLFLLYMCAGGCINSKNQKEYCKNACNELGVKECIGREYKILHPTYVNAIVMCHGAEKRMYVIDGSKQTLYMEQK